MRQRDRQRNRAYLAESALRNFLKEEELTLEEANDFAKDVWPPIKQVNFTRNQSCWWHHGTSTIDLARWGRTELTLLHEIAHAIREASCIVDETHGRIWASIFCFLVFFYLGADAHKLLCLVYDAANIQHRLKTLEWFKIASAMRYVMDEALLEAANETWITQIRVWR